MQPLRQAVTGRTLTREGSAPEEPVHVREDELDHDGLHTHLHEGRRAVEAGGLYVLRPVRMRSHPHPVPHVIHTLPESALHPFPAMPLTPLHLLHHIRGSRLQCHFLQEAFLDTLLRINLYFLCTLGACL